jgi:hypothetical protein
MADLSARSCFSSGADIIIDGQQEQKARTEQELLLFMYQHSLIRSSFALQLVCKLLQPVAFSSPGGICHLIIEPLHQVRKCPNCSFFFTFSR